MKNTQPISHDQALKIIRQSAEGFDPGQSVVSVNDACGRVLATDICASVDVPSCDASAMDGFAIAYADISNFESQTFTLQDSVFAGDVRERVLQPGGHAIAITTGACIPTGADTVVIKENTHREGELIRVSDVGQKGANIRRRGEDIKTGQLLFHRGHRLRAQDLGACASVGCEQLAVRKKIKVVLLSGGDEVVQPGQALQPGQVYDSVSAMCAAMLENAGCEVIERVFLQDDASRIDALFIELKNKKQPFLLVSVGGVSAGEKDHIHGALQRCGEILFHKVRIKPGFPMLHGRLGQGLCFGLPGNPVSAFATLCHYVLPAIRWIHGEPKSTVETVSAKLTHDWNKQHYRREFLRGQLSVAAGHFEVTVNRNQSSGRLSSVTEANCFVILDESHHTLRAGDAVPVLRFVDLFNTHLL